MLRKIQKGVPMLAKNTTEYFVGEKINECRKKLVTIEGSGITLTSNVIKNIIEVIR